VYLVVRGLRQLWVSTKDPERMFGSSVLLGVAVAYLLLAVFERFLINVGNPTSLLFLLCIMRQDFNKTSSAEEETAQPVQEEEVTGEFGSDASRA